MSVLSSEEPIDHKVLLSKAGCLEDINFNVMKFGTYIIVYEKRWFGKTLDKSLIIWIISKILTSM
jgi:hypothetical protein